MSTPTANAIRRNNRQLTYNAQQQALQQQAQSPMTYQPLARPDASTMDQFDPTGIGLQHYHDALGQAGRHVKADGLPMTPQEAMKFSQDNWTMMKPAERDLMVRQLAPRYGQMKAPTAASPAPASPGAQAGLRPAAPPPMPTPTSGQDVMANVNTAMQAGGAKVPRPDPMIARMNREGIPTGAASDGKQWYKQGTAGNVIPGKVGADGNLGTPQAPSAPAAPVAPNPLDLLPKIKGNIATAEDALATIRKPSSLSGPAATAPTPTATPLPMPVASGTAPAGGVPQGLRPPAPAMPKAQAAPDLTEQRLKPKPSL